MTEHKGKRQAVSRVIGSNDDSPVGKHRGNFRFNTISALALGVFLGIGFGLQSAVMTLPESEVVAQIAAGVLSGAVLLFILPYWPMVIALVAVTWATLPVLFDVDLQLLAGVISIGFLLSPGLEVISQWDKIVVLRLGKFHKVRGPGLLLLFPLLDAVAGYVDTRIRATDFSAEMSLTRDTVPVNIDALAFWMIWDAERAILEVQDFKEAVTLSAQTALRASIGANDLSTLLSERDRLGDEIKQIVDAKTNPWGISILSVEFKEILIPKELEDALSRQAQASRERNSRIILSSAEVEIAKNFTKAADDYRDDPVALQLRAMNMIYEGIRNKGGLVLVPASALENMNLGTVLGAKVYSDSSAANPTIGTADAGPQSTE
ncbi:MAG: slipin family protein [Spirochaetales bacterium]|nr:slipin family protein [Spirochaetales bacterium]